MNSSFLKYTLQFYDGVFERYQSPNGPFLFATEALDDMERADLALYLDEILSGKLSDNDLSELWKDGNACLWVENGIRAFLTMARVTLDRPGIET